MKNIIDTLKQWSKLNWQFVIVWTSIFILSYFMWSWIFNKLFGI